MSSLSNSQTSGRTTREISSKKPIHYCDYCRDDITNTIYIKCEECKSFVICVDCFSHGFAVYPHLPTHAYRVIRFIPDPLYDRDWSAGEELLLLEGIELYGLGNWAEIANHVGTKAKARCESHYNERYLESPVAPLPDNKLPFPSILSDARSSSTLTTAAGRGPGGKQHHRNVDSRDYLRQKEKEIENASYRALQLQHKGMQKNSIGSLVGYSSHRREFEAEYENDAELLIADLEFKTEDAAWERDLKLRVLELYNSKLDNRDSRREFLISRGLLLKRETRRTKEEKIIYAKLRPFARFLSQIEFEEFVQGIIAETRLRKRIEQLQTYRMNGLRTFTDGIAYDYDMQRKHHESLAERYLTIPISQKVINGMDKVKRVSNEASETNETEKGNDERSNKKQKTQEESEKEKEKDDQETKEATTSSTTHSSSPSTAPSAAMSNIINIHKNTTRTPHQLPPITDTTHTSTTKFCVNSMEGVTLLSLAERELCQELMLTPQHYLIIKEKIVREAMKHGACSQGKAKQLLRVDITSSGKIIDFFISHGWLSSEPTVSEELQKQNQHIQMLQASPQIVQQKNLKNMTKNAGNTGNTGNTGNNATSIQNSQKVLKK